METFRNQKYEKDIFLNRVLLAFFIVGLMVFIIFARLVFLQIINHQHFQTLSLENHIKVRPVAPPRGLILSQDGVPLAENRPSFSLVAVPEKLSNFDKTLSSLAKIVELPQITRKELVEELKSSPSFANVVLKPDLTAKELSVFSVNGHLFPGVFVQAGLSRHYPFGEATAHVLGYVGKISEVEEKFVDKFNYAATLTIGKTGVEKSQENTLHGLVGEQTIEVNAQGRVLRVLERKPPVPGNDVILTLDSSLQQVAIDTFKNLEGLSGAVVAMEPTTGAILASVSYPSFDPNNFVNGISRDLFTQLTKSKSRPLFDRTIKGQYPPGSTIKPIVALSALEDGVSSVKKTNCPGWYSLRGDRHRYRCWEKDGHGKVGLKRAIVKSCDVYFYKTAEKLGIDKMSRTLRQFGFGMPTGIDLPGERAGLLPSPAWKRKNRGAPWYPGETLITGIGQGFLLATPLQLAQMTATLANNGYRPSPYVVQQIEGKNEIEIPIQKTLDSSLVSLIDSENWTLVTESMFDVVHSSEGTARGSGYGATVQFAGKTGTSQVFSIGQDEEIDEDSLPHHLKDHALFIAFSPVENPQIALAVVVEHGSSGSATAAPIARKLFDSFFAQGYQNNE